MIIHTHRCTESKSEHRTCSYHKEHPFDSYAGCCCSSSYGIGPCQTCGGSGLVGGGVCPRLQKKEREKKRSRDAWKRWVS